MRCIKPQRRPRVVRSPQIIVQSILHCAPIQLPQACERVVSYALHVRQGKDQRSGARPETHFLQVVNIGFILACGVHGPNTQQIWDKSCDWGSRDAFGLRISDNQECDAPG